MPGIGEIIAKFEEGRSRPEVSEAVARVQARLTHKAPAWGEVEQTLTAVPTAVPTAPTRAQQVAEDIGMAKVLERLGLPPVTPEGVVSFAPAPMTEEQIIAEYSAVLEKLGMPVREPTIEGLREAIGKRYEAPIHEAVPIIGGMDVGLPDILGGVKDIGKWVLYGALAIGGIYVLGKFLGGKK